MGIKRPRLHDLVRQAHAGEGAADWAQYGPRRAVVQCHHGAQRYDIGQVRGYVVIGVTWPHDLRYASYDVFVRCRRCPGETGLRVLDLAKIRAALREPHTGTLKINVDDVSRRLE